MRGGEGHQRGRTEHRRGELETARADEGEAARRLAALILDRVIPEAAK